MNKKKHRRRGKKRMDRKQGNVSHEHAHEAKNDAIDYYKKMGEASKLINDESNRLITWSLSIIGGSILTMLGTEYVKPSGSILYTYFLFILGWASLGASIYFGEILTRNFIAGAIAPENDLDRTREIGLEMNQHFSLQLRYFYGGITIFAIWLISFLTWFILYRRPEAYAH